MINLTKAVNAMSKLGVEIKVIATNGGLILQASRGKVTSEHTFSLAVMEKFSTENKNKEFMNILNNMLSDIEEKEICRPKTVMIGEDEF